MSITVTLFQGTLGLLVGSLAVFGAFRALLAAEEWLADRFTVDVRHMKVHLRWDRWGALVDLADGRRATIMYVVADQDAGNIAAVQPYEADGETSCQPEWILLEQITPVIAVPA